MVVPTKQADSVTIYLINVYFAVFVFGAIIGSFLNVVLFRKNTGESIVNDRSRCFSCGKKLSWYELIPILSFVIQKRKCRPPPGGCGSEISWQYLFIELITGFLAVAILTQAELGSFSFYFAAFCSLFLVAAYDFKHKVIDRHFLWIFAGFSAIEFTFQHFNISTFTTAVAIFLLFYSLWRFSGGRWMGRGDADLAFFLSLFLGHPLSLFMLLGAFWVGAALGIILLIVFKKKFTMKSEVPFGPFLAFSTLVVWCFGDTLKLLYEILYF